MKKILIAAGGTGGHIFPALAFGHWLAAENKARKITYLCGSRPLETEIYASRGIEPYRLDLQGSPLGVSSWTERLRRFAGLLKAFFQVFGLIRREKPDIFFLFGGYVSLMPLLACRVLNIPTIVHEQNAYAGKVTRLASRLGFRIASGWSACHGLSGPFTPVGIPVRKLRRIPRGEAARLLGLEGEIAEGTTVVGVVGGSIGAFPLSSLAALSGGLFENSSEWPFFVVLGEGESDIPNVCFIGRKWDTDPFFSLCDAVICRAGASTLAELLAYGIPALVVPWKNAADGHQIWNARSFSELTGSPVLLDGGEDGFEEAFSDLLELLREKKISVRPNDASSALWDFFLQSV